jgi:hypothetical protein
VTTHKSSVISHNPRTFPFIAIVSHPLEVLTTKGSRFCVLWQQQQTAAMKLSSLGDLSYNKSIFTDFPAAF